jgi:diaminopimelate decarboxylase
MTDNPRYALYGSKYTVINASNPKGRKDTVATIAGRCCESGDLIQEDVEIQTPKRGDYLAVLVTGAYNYSMASNYNRVQKPAMVLVNNSQSDIIINRETLEDLVSHDLIPDRLKK